MILPLRLQTPLFRDHSADCAPIPPHTVLHPSKKKRQARAVGCLIKKNV